MIYRERRIIDGTPIDVLWRDPEMTVCYGVDLVPPETMPETESVLTIRLLRRDTTTGKTSVLIEQHVRPGDLSLDEYGRPRPTIEFEPWYSVIVQPSQAIDLQIVTHR